MTTVLKVIEILAQSDKGWEDAANNAVVEASKSLRDVRSINVSNFSATVEDGRIMAYRLNAKLSFGLESIEAPNESLTQPTESQAISQSPDDI